jgi:hypothetical protein
LPNALEDDADEGRPVLVTDAFVSFLEMTALNFSRAETCMTGREP